MKREDATVAGRAVSKACELQVYSDVNRVLTFASIVLLGLLASSQLFPENPVGLALKLLFFAFLILSLKNWMAAMLLVLVQIPLFVVPQSRRYDTSLTGDEVVLALQLVLMLALMSRMHSPIGQRSRVRQTLKFLLGRDSDFKLPREKGIQAAISAGRNFAISTLLLSIVLLVITSLASMFLQVVPMDSGFKSSLRAWAGIESWGFRLIVLGGVMCSCVLLAWLMIAVVNFRRLSVREASMYLRSQVVKWLHRDFRMVSRRIRRQKRKRA